MDRRIMLNVFPMFGVLPPPYDWLFRSFTPYQMEFLIMKTCFMSQVPGGDEIRNLSVQSSPDEMYFLKHQAEEFQSYVREGDRFYLLFLASPVLHEPNYGNFHNTALSYHVFAKQKYIPLWSRDRLKLALLKFLSSPDALVFPPGREDPCESSGSAQEAEDGTAKPAYRFGQVPVRAFMFRLDDICCPGHKHYLCEETYSNIRYQASRMPLLRMPYSSSVYILTKSSKDNITAHCIAYLTKNLIKPTFKSPTGKLY
ncbi:hypothetical protein GE061_009587 [Apolygus lucorum]|uniref:Uncharacterized protein n=1 Tax=Apolygus lucorum TaxID=248454 RepID=A0A8S9Y1Y3_APOLU|nr:hypothetical protein GE061_009587 [Apolygus lucorum]